MKLAELSPEQCTPELYRNALLAAWAKYAISPDMTQVDYRSSKTSMHKLPTFADFTTSEDTHTRRFASELTDLQDDYAGYVCLKNLDLWKKTKTEFRKQITHNNKPFGWVNDASCSQLDLYELDGIVFTLGGTYQSVGIPIARSMRNVGKNIPFE